MAAFLWRFSGLIMVVYLAAIQGLPREYQEHAVLEGHPVTEGPQIVAQCEIARGGDAGEDPAHGAHGTGCAEGGWAVR